VSTYTPAIEAPPASPSLERLAQLEPETCACVVLAQVSMGATWDRCDDPQHMDPRPRWRLALNGGYCFIWWDQGDTFTQRLPNPLCDPAAAYELEERELTRWERLGPEGRLAHRFGWGAPDACRVGTAHPSRKHAAVLAVLAKHENGPYAPLVRLALRVARAADAVRIDATMGEERR
jgi:hypothetical protein